MRRVLLAVLAALTVAAAVATPANAAPVTFQFTGSVTQINADPGDPFGGAIDFGTLFSGSYTFNSTAIDSIGSATDGSFPSAGAPYGISVDFDGDPFGAFSIVGVTVNTRNGAPDQYGVFGFDGSLQIEFLLEAFAANPFANDLLPLTPPNIANFNSRVFTFRSDDLDGNQVEILGTLDSLTGPPPPLPVPEPATLGMLTVGLVAAARRLQMRRRAERTVDR